MSEIYVFLGPTLAEKEARAELDAVYLPPVSAGDIYRLWRRRPRAIGIVDGYFDHVPAVWHKEIMWVMERGVHVFGGAGLGALRAAGISEVVAVDLTHEDFGIPVVRVIVPGLEGPTTTVPNCRLGQRAANLIGER